MTLPGGPDNIDLANSLFGISAYGNGQLSPADLAGQDEDTVRATYVGRYVTGSESVWSDPAGVLAQLFGGLAGLPAMLANLLGELLGIDLSHVTDIPSLIAAVGGKLGEAIGQVVARIQVLIDALFNALNSGASTIFNTIEDLVQAVLHIPSTNVLGVGGPSTIGESLLEAVNYLIGGFVGIPGVGASLADLFNIGNLISGKASLGAFAWDILGIRNNTPVNEGLLPSSQSNFGLTSINTTLATTQAAALSVTLRVRESAPLGVVSWLGYGTTGLTAFYLNIRRIDPVTASRDLVHHSPNIVGDLIAGTVPGWNFYNLDTPLARVAGEEYAYEFVPVGGTHHIRGMSLDDDIPDHPYANVVSLGSTVNYTSSPNSPASSIAKASVVTSSDLVWIETAIDTGNASDAHDPVTLYLTESGTVPIPNWADFIEAIPLGAGGAGYVGGTLGFYGEGGKAGKFGPATWQRGVDFDDSVVSVTFTCGAGTGGTGGASTFAITGVSTTGAGGAPGSGLRFGGRMLGESPVSLVYNDQHYVAGGTQSNYGAPGAAPGGGGGGGNWISFQAGGRGGAGAGWLRFRQAPRDEESVGDTIPPSPPSLTLDAVTFSTFTVTPEGGED